MKIAVLAIFVASAASGFGLECSGYMKLTHTALKDCSSKCSYSLNENGVPPLSAMIQCTKCVFKGMDIRLGPEATKTAFTKLRRRIWEEDEAFVRCFTEQKILAKDQLKAIFNNLKNYQKQGRNGDASTYGYRTMEQTLNNGDRRMDLNELFVKAGECLDAACEK